MKKLFLILALNYASIFGEAPFSKTLNKYNHLLENFSSDPCKDSAILKQFTYNLNKTHDENFLYFVAHINWLLRNYSLSPKPADHEERKGLVLSADKTLHFCSLDAEGDIAILYYNNNQFFQHEEYFNDLLSKAIKNPDSCLGEAYTYFNEKYKKYSQSSLKKFVSAWIINNKIKYKPSKQDN